MTIHEAYEALGKATKQPFCIALEVWCHTLNEGQAVEWEVWSSETNCHHAAVTLAEAVAKALEALKPKPERDAATLAEAEAATEGVK